MRKALIILAVVNVAVSLMFILVLSSGSFQAEMWTEHNLREIDEAGAIDYERLGKQVMRKDGPATREDLAHLVGVQNTRAFGKAAVYFLLLLVAQTGAIVFCALRIRPSAQPPSTLAGHMPQG